MVWDHLSITSAHVVYIILGGFTSIFMLCSSVIKERMYIGEATVATLIGVIFGPHAANLINPKEWGNVDEITLEFSRIVLVVQCFAVGVELPKFYMERHWKSVVFLLIPVMTWGWLLVSVFIWWLVPPLNWVESLVVAACMTATDPVLASSVVGKGKFAKRVPKHLRDLLSAESGCNDGMAFPFVYLGIYLIQEHLNPGESLYHWFVYTVLYECVFGAIYGFAIGYIARHSIKYAEKHDLIDRESFLVFYFTLALFCAGSGSLLGTDDLLVGFAAGVGFSNDGWFSEKTEESHVSNVIDLLLNLTYFVYFGTIIPWEQFNDEVLGLSAWKLTVIAILVIFFRRIPIMLILKPVIPDVKTWREALFAGHFGPIGVGAVFVAILARAELSVEKTIPTGDLPALGEENHFVTLLVWPIVTFMVVASILVHGSSIAVFTLGKRINTLQLTMSYTTAAEDGPSWMNRLPRISSQSKSQARTMSDTEYEDMKSPQFPPGTLGPTGYPGAFLRRQRDEEGSHQRSSSRASSRVSRKRRKRWDDGIGPGGPVSQSAIFPQRQSTGDNLGATTPGESQADTQPESPMVSQDMANAKEKHGDSTSDEVGPKGEQVPELSIYDEGDHVIIEDQDGQVLAVEDAIDEHTKPNTQKIKEKAHEELQKPGWTYESFKRSVGKWRDEEIQKRKEKPMSSTKHAPARAYQFGNTIIVEDEDGEVVKKYELPSEQAEGKDYFGQGMKLMGMGGLVEKKGDKEKPADGTAAGSSDAGPSQRPGIRQSFSAWGGFKRGGPVDEKKKGVEQAAQEEAPGDDRQIRFTIGGVGRRMTKDDFLKEVQMLDSKTRKEVVDQSSASPAVKIAAREGVPVINEPPKESRSPKKERSPAQDQEVGTSSSSSTSSGKQPLRAPQEQRGRSGTIGSNGSGDKPSTAEPETAAERRRRLAAFATVRDDAETDETPAERRRRQAALGGSAEPVEDSDSDDDNTERVPPARRGIRFADNKHPKTKA